MGLRQKESWASRHTISALWGQIKIEVILNHPTKDKKKNILVPLLSVPPHILFKLTRL